LNKRVIRIVEKDAVAIFSKVGGIPDRDVVAAYAGKVANIEGIDIDCFALISNEIVEWFAVYCV